MPQAERVILEAEDEVTPVVNKANAGLQAFENKAESSHGKVIRITDQTRSSIQRLIASLENQAEMYGKSGADRLIAQRDSLLQRYAKEPQAIDAITRAYERMIETQKKTDAEALLEKQSRAIQSFGQRVSQGIQNPMQGASGAVGSLLTKMGPLGIGMVAGGAAVAGFALATWDAVKSLGAYGVQVKDAELRTGLTAREVVQFGFAARAVGQDVSIFERLMRGLSTAVEDTGKEGEKARAWLTRFGVDIQGVRTGTEPTSQVLLRVAKGLEGLPPGFDRTRVAMDLFKRAGIEAIPVMDGLRERVNRAKELGFGPSEADVKKYEELNQKAVEFEMRWESAVRSVKGILVDLASAFGWVLDKIATKAPALPKVPEAEQRAHTSHIADLEKQGTAALQAQVNLLQKQTEAYKPGVMNYVKSGLASVVGRTYVPSGPGAQQYGQAAVQLRDVQEALDALANKPQPHAPLMEPPSGGTGDNGLTAAMRQARREIAGTDEDKFAALGAERQEAINEALDKYKAKAGPLVALIQQLYDAKWVKAFNTEAERTNKGLEEQSEKWHRLSLEASKAAGQAFREDIAEGTKKLEEQGKVVGKLAAEWAKLGAAGESQAVAHQKRMIQINANPEDTLGTLSQLQVIDLGEIQKRRQSALGELSTDPAQAILQRAVAEKEAANAVGELRYQWAEKITELKHKAAEEQQKMLDEQEKSIERVADKLLDTLLTKPRNFAKEFEKTIHEAVLKPVVEGFGSMAASAIRLAIYGDDGKGGIAGAFKGVFGGAKSSDPVKLSTDQNTTATIQNSAHVAALTAVLAGAMGMAPPAVATPAGIGGVSLPAISIPAVASPARLALPWTGGGGGGVGGAAAPGALAGPSLSDLMNLPTTQPSMWQFTDPIGGPAPGGAPTVSELANLPVSHPNALFQTLGLGLLGKGAGPGGAGSLMLSNLKGAVWNQTAYQSLGIPYTAGSKLESGGLAMATSPAATAAGMMLATSGLLGSHMGSGAGIAMGGIGGALTGAGMGMQFGGPMGALLGAGIGAVAGIGIGVGEKLAGIESPQVKAHNDIKQIYGLDIPANSGTIKQVVSIAQSQFGGDIAVAVRSPNVRQLVMLYSEATGQKMPLSASTPYAGSLVEQGGNLYQQASFQNNAWHSYTSSLPTLGGVGGSPYPTTPTPNTSGGTGSTYLSLNINGTPITADYVADQSMAAQNASYGRTQQSANLQVPGLMVS